MAKDDSLRGLRSSGHLSEDVSTVRRYAMRRFEDDRYYRTLDPEIASLATPGTLAQWRYHGRGPSYYKFGRRIVYRGRDLNEWIDAHLVETTAREGEHEGVS